MIRRTIICCLLSSLNVAAQGQEPFDSISTQASKPSLMERLHQVQQYLDEKAKAKVDPHYIEVSDKPWRVVLRYKESAFDVGYSNIAGNPSAGDGAEYEMCFEPPMAPSIGFWVGYRGTGISFAKSLRKKEGTTLSFSTTGAKYGANLRLRGFDMNEMTLTSTIYEDGKVASLNGDGYLGVPVSIASLYLDGAGSRARRLLRPCKGGHLRCPHRRRHHHRLPAV